MPVRLREVVYTVSPFEVTVLNGLVKDFPSKVMRHLTEVGKAALVGLLCYTCCLPPSCMQSMSFIHLPPCTAERAEHGVLVRGTDRCNCLVRLPRLQTHLLRSIMQPWFPLSAQG